MVNGGKNAENCERNAHLQRGLSERDTNGRETHAEEKHQHHLPAPPQIPHAPSRDRGKTKHHEGAHCVGHHVFPTGDPKILGNGAYSGGKNQ